MLNSLILTEREETKNQIFPTFVFLVCHIVRKRKFMAGSIHARCKLNFLEDTDTLGSEISNLDTSYLIVFANWLFSTGKSFSEALILASTNPQYDERVFIDLPI